MADKEKVIEFYDEYIERQQHVGINERHFSILKKLKENGLQKDHKVLEVGCGIGTLTKLLLDYLKKGTLYGLDITPENIKLAKERLKAYSNVTFNIADATDFCLDETFDVIVMPDVIEHIPLELHARMFINMKKMLKKGGFIFMHFPNPFHTEHCLKQGMQLQIIDQAVHLNLIVDNLKGSGLFVSKMEIYGVLLIEGEYEYVILQNESKFENFNEIDKSIPFLKRIRQKIQYEWKKLF
jgi:2-polyprenyl-3-methyl-5-hydroxy-6-metoxy-1,4-benzoquinol methylase